MSRPTDRCPVCGDPLPRQTQARRVAHNGVVVCARATCEQKADDLSDAQIAAARDRGPRRAGALLLALTAEEREELRAAAARDDRPLGAWIRRAALAAARATSPGRS